MSKIGHLRVAFKSISSALPPLATIHSALVRVAQEVSLIEQVFGGGPPILRFVPTTVIITAPCVVAIAHAVNLARGNYKGQSLVDSIVDGAYHEHRVGIHERPMADTSRRARPSHRFGTRAHNTPLVTLDDAPTHPLRSLTQE